MVSAAEDPAGWSILAPFPVNPFSIALLHLFLPNIQRLQILPLHAMFTDIQPFKRT